MSNDRSTNLGFTGDAMSTGGLLSGSVELSAQANQEIHLSTCAVFQSEYSEDDSLIFQLLDIGIVNEYMAEYIKKRLSGAKQGSILNPKSDRYLTQNLVGENGTASQTRFIFHGI